MDLIFAIRDALRTLMLDLCSIIYKLMTVTYDVFERIGTATLLQDNATFKEISNKIGLILGLFMVFRITFSFIQYIINPDNMLDKSKGIQNIIKKVIISIVLLGSVGGLFDLAYKVQDLLVESKVVERVILGDDYAQSDNFGNVLSETLFFSFFRLDDNQVYELDTKKNNTEAEDCIELQDVMRGDVRDYNNFEIVFSCLNSKGTYVDHTKGKDVERYVYTFDGGGILALAVGCFALYSICMFTIQVGVRLVQLAYLQIIAPIPIMMYITPKGDDYLKKWGQQCLTTFLDFFIRSAAIFFVVFIINALIEEMKSSTSGLWTDNAGINIYILVIMILALFHFAKKFPSLLKEILPSLGGAAGFSYGLSFKKNVAEPFKSMYNSPLGWGLKLGNGAIKGIDRKAHGKNFFGDSAIRKGIDKWLPEQAAARKKRIEARQVLEDNDELEGLGKDLLLKYKDEPQRDKDGKIIYDKDNKPILYGDTLPAYAFKNEEYRRSYIAVGEAKGKKKAAERELSRATSAYNAAQINGTAEEKARAEARLDAAERDAKIATAEFDKAKETHDKLKDIYTEDAKKENAFNYYKDRNPGEVDRYVHGTNESTNSQGSNENSQGSAGNTQDPYNEGPSQIGNSEGTGDARQHQNWDDVGE